MNDEELEGPPPKQRRTAAWIALAAVVFAGAGGVAYYLRWRAAADLAAPAADPSVATAPQEVEVDAGPPPVPEDGDALLRKRAAEASKTPELAAPWLAAPGIVQRIAAAVRLVADGKSPRPVLGFIEVTGPFSVVEHVATRVGPGDKRTPDYGTERDFIAPESYARYDGLVRIFTSVDPVMAGQAYAELRPYFDAAFAQVARKGEKFDDVLSAAINRLVVIHVADEPVEVVPKGALYAFKEPELEARANAEKHLFRMGPKNAHAIQDALRRFAESAGLRR